MAEVSEGVRAELRARVVSLRRRLEQAVERGGVELHVSLEDCEVLITCAEALFRASELREAREAFDRARGGIASAKGGAL